MREIINKINDSIDVELKKTVRTERLDDIKSSAICKLDASGKYTNNDYGLEIEILGTMKHTISKGVHGIELFARAWKDGKPIGFGIDGTVEIERFRIFNPAILIYDPNGDIVRNKVHPITGVEFEARYREDPIMAIRNTVAHNIKVSGKVSDKIITGKIGNTTDTFYPSMDGWVRRVSVTESFATIRAGAGNGSNTSNADIQCCITAAGSSNNYSNLARAFVIFDTSALPDSDTISSATFSLQYFDSSYIVDTFTSDTTANRSISICGSTPASDSALANTDFGNIGSTNYATADIAIGSLVANNSTYNDWTLNATGIAAISPTGNSRFGVRTTFDLNNTSPTWIASKNAEADFNSADVAGTSHDPKLTVVHAAGGASQNSNYFMRRK